MIDLKELRIGNLVSLNGRYIDVESISSAVINITGEDEEFGGFIGDSWRDIEPIPLTPELLVKCRFKKVEIDAYSDLFKRTTKDFMFSVIYNYIQDKATFNSPHFTQFIQHLHQLQNLYFSLTGEELQINV